MSQLIKSLASIKNQGLTAEWLYISKLMLSKIHKNAIIVSLSECLTKFLDTLVICSSILDR